MSFLKVRPLCLMKNSFEMWSDHYESKTEKKGIDKAAILNKFFKQKEHINNIHEREQKSKKNDDPEKFLRESLNKMENNNQHKLFLNKNTASQGELLGKKRYVFWENWERIWQIKWKYIVDENGNIDWYIKNWLFWKKWVVDNEWNKKAYIDKKWIYHKL